MKRFWIASIAFIGVGVAVVLSNVGGGNGTKTQFTLEERNPVTHLRWNDAKEEFRIAIVSDRTGGHRADIFAQAVERLNLMQPEFVLSVGDLIEGGKKTDDKYAAEWKQFDDLVNKLQMPFFYVPGNHDSDNKDSAKYWEGKLGRRYYHFVYRNVLFLMLNSNDPVTTVGKEQLAYVQKTLKDNAEVAWTVVCIHHPLWNNNNGVKNGWGDVEKALNGRKYTVFCGHVHRYEKFVRQGMNYYQLATTGGSSKVRGVDYAEFDQFVWLTMKKDGPVFANILLDSVYNESLDAIKTKEPGVSTAKRKATHPVRGFAYFEGVPMVGANVTFSLDDGKAKGSATSIGTVEGDGSFKLSTYKGFDGAPAGKYNVAVTWREPGKGGPSRIPAKYNSPANSGLSATVEAMGPNEITLELKK